jgi:hypothetical protein
MRSSVSSRASRRVDALLRAAVDASDVRGIDPRVLAVDRACERAVYVSFA